MCLNKHINLDESSNSQIRPTNSTNMETFEVVAMASKAVPYVTSEHNRRILLYIKINLADDNRAPWTEVTLLTAFDDTIHKMDVKRTELINKVSDPCITERPRHQTFISLY